jgi:L-2-hydroxyglutarate oxidase LhgO
VEVIKGEEIRDIRAPLREASGTHSVFSYGHLVNAAGLHADHVAHIMGVGLHYRILPFKGLYRKLKKDAAKRFNGSIYPVPDLRVPFLGVHVTRNIHDDVYVGPTAIPAFGRENYGMFEGVSLSEAPGIAWALGKMILKNKQGMRTMVGDEMSRYSASGFLQAAQACAPRLQASDFDNTGKVGLRAQLYDRNKGTLEMDFVVEPGPDSTHVLNAISPAFTSSLAFAEWIADKVERKN